MEKHFQDYVNIILKMHFWNACFLEKGNHELCQHNFGKAFLDVIFFRILQIQPSEKYWRFFELRIMENV